MKRLNFTFIRITGFILFFITVELFSQTWNPVALKSYPFIDSHSNFIQVSNKSILKPVLAKFANTHKKKLNIIHLGDYEVQNGIYSTKLKSNFQNNFGYGGYGYFFANSTARITGVNNYQTYHYGKWVYAKNSEKYPELPLGISGVTSKTFDEESQIKIVLNKQQIKSDYKKLHIYCKRSHKSFDIKVVTKSDSQRIDVYNSPRDSFSSEIVIDLKYAEPSLIIEFRKKYPEQTNFELYGFSLESESDKGILFHSIGHNGAGFSHVIREPHLKSDLNLLKPDVVILDLGIYDFFTIPWDEKYIQRSIVTLINIIKTTTSKPAIVLISPNDQLKGKYSWDILGKYSLLLADIARKEKVGFYDWYRVSGGNKSIQQWIDTGLAYPNGRELTEKGYLFKGNLLYNAFCNTFLRYNPKFDSENSLIIPIKDSTYLFRIDTSRKNEVIQPIIAVPIYDWVKHTVRRNENIYSIASHYDVSALQIKHWNKLRKNSVKKGQKLRIYTKVGETIPSSVLPKNQNSTVIKSEDVADDANKHEELNNKQNTHKVQRKETLFSISKKYNMTVNELKELNHIQGNSISIGQILLVK